MKSDDPIHSRVQSGDTRLIYQFAGQGSLWFRELSRNYHEGPSSVKTLIDRCLQSIGEEKENLRTSSLSSTVWDVQTWLEDPEYRPPEESEIEATISVPMIFLTQLSHWESLVASGYERDLLYRSCAGVLGHSQGLAAGALIALGLDGEDYLRAAEKFMKFMLYLGYRVQESYPYAKASQEEKLRSADLDLGEFPAPMAALIGSDHEAVGDFLKRYASMQNVGKPLVVGLFNAPENRIISGARTSILSFYESFRQEFIENEMRLIYLQTTAPFHSELVKDVCDTLRSDIERIGFAYESKELLLPLYSFADGRDMRQDTDFVEKLFREITVETLYWPSCLASVAKLDYADCVLDFGPGKAVRRISEDYFKTLGVEKTFLSPGLKRDLKILLRGLNA